MDPTGHQLRRHGMQRECAWCQTIMAPGTLPATHGICPACAQKLEG